MLCSHEESLLEQTKLLQALACKRKNLRARNLQMSQNLLSSKVNFYEKILGGTSSCAHTSIRICSLHKSHIVPLLSSTGALICFASCLNLKIFQILTCGHEQLPNALNNSTWGETTLSSNRTRPCYASCAHGRPTPVEFFEIYNVWIQRMWFL